MGYWGNKQGSGGITCDSNFRTLKMSLTYMLYFFFGMYGTWQCQYSGLSSDWSHPFLLLQIKPKTSFVSLWGDLWLLNTRITSQPLPPAGPFPQRTNGCGGAGKWYWLLAVAVASVCSGLKCMLVPIFEHKLALDTNGLDPGLTRCLYWTSSET